MAFRQLWWSLAVSNVCDGVRLAALPVLAAACTAQPLLVSAVVVLPRLPWLIAPLLAVPIDTADRRRFLAAADLSRGVALLAAAAVALLAGVSIPLLIAVGVVLGVGEVYFNSALTAMLPAVAPADRLLRANARLATTETVAQSAGHPLGGFLAGVAAAAPLVFDAVTYFGSWWFVRQVPPQVPVPNVAARGDGLR
ncbi:hypothetical protein GCM10010170_024290 [Dactylosporangium salmoneum]|uniref:MFS transporter n=1 Tax=Dactylosporangium salmoneum TaxID=53361 RepID=A0ABP5T1Q3_9ACTN